MVGRDSEAISHDDAGAPLAASARVWALVGLLLLAAVLFTSLLVDHRFHADEALFATLGRLIISGEDVLLTETTLLVDKPPLFLYTLAAGIGVSWGDEISARLPGLFASLISVALAARLAWHLWRSNRAAMIAGFLYAISPFTILFAPTAFADPQLVMWVLAALVVVTGSRRGGARWGWSGLLVGLAVATKQSGLFFVPLVVGLGLVRSSGHGIRWREAGRAALSFAAGFGVVIALMAGWDIARRPAASFWAQGMAVNNPGGLAAVGALAARAWQWLGWLRYFWGEGWIGLGIFAVVMGVSPVVFIRRSSRREKWYVLVLFGFCAAYLIAHWLVPVPVLDRYLLPLVPLLAVLFAGIGWLAFRERQARPEDWLVFFAGLLLAWPAMRAAEGRIPVGGDHGAYDGIDRIGEWLEELPEGSVVYYQSMGWPLAWYAYDAPVYLAPYADADALRDDLRAFGENRVRRVLIVPDWEDIEPVREAALAAGFETERVSVPGLFTFESPIAVYDLRNPLGPSHYRLVLSAGS